MIVFARNGMRRFCSKGAYRVTHYGTMTDAARLKKRRAKRLSPFARLRITI
jgi:hypothetical protein